MNVSWAVAFAGGAAVAAALSGAASALTTLSPAVVALCGCILAISALSKPARTPATLGAAIGGAACGLLLPCTAPIPPGDVRARAPAGHVAGDIFDALDQLDRAPQTLLGARITVTGQWLPPTSGRPAAVFRRVMSCCAADAVAVGFEVEPSGPPYVASIKGGTVNVRVSGVVRARMRDGELRYVLAAASVTPLSPRSAVAR